MKEMKYRAYDSKGEVQEGLIKGESHEEILQILRKKNLIVVELKPAKNLTFVESVFQFKFLSSIKIEELIVFTRQFYTLFKAGLSIDILLATLTKQTQNQLLKESLTQIHEDVQQGTSLSKAFEKHPKVFTNLYISMLAAGEEAGILEESLLELCRVLEKENELNQEIKSATLYPKIVVAVMFGAFWSMITFVIPKFSEMYKGFNATLPLPTRILIMMSDFATHYWYMILFALIGLIFGTQFLLKQAWARLWWDEKKLKIPIFGNLFNKIAMARFGHFFAALYRSGLPLVRSFEVLSRLIGNESYALEIDRFREGLLKGKTIAEVMRNSKLFPIIVVETTAIGEQSGNLDTMLSAMASHFDLEIKHITKNLTTMLEPILLVGMFGMVTLMALGIFLPMWNLSKVVLTQS